MGTSESAVENFAVGEVRGQAFPHAYTGTAREEGEVGDWLAFGVFLLESRDRLGEAGGAGSFLGGKRMGHEQQDGWQQERLHEEFF